MIAQTNLNDRIPKEFKKNRLANSKQSCNINKSDKRILKKIVEPNLNYRVKNKSFRFVDQNQSNLNDRVTKLNEYVEF